MCLFLHVALFKHLSTLLAFPSLFLTSLFVPPQLVQTKYRTNRIMLWNRTDIQLTTLVINLTMRSWKSGNVSASSPCLLTHSESRFRTSVTTRTLQESVLQRTNQRVDGLAGIQFAVCGDITEVQRLKPLRGVERFREYVFVCQNRVT